MITGLKPLGTLVVAQEVVVGAEQLDALRGRLKTCRSNSSPRRPQRQQNHSMRAVMERRHQPLLSSRPWAFTMPHCHCPDFERMMPSSPPPCPSMISAHSACSAPAPIAEGLHPPLAPDSSAGASADSAVVAPQSLVVQEDEILALLQRYWRIAERIDSQSAWLACFDQLSVLVDLCRLRHRTLAGDLSFLAQIARCRPSSGKLAVPTGLR